MKPTKRLQKKIDKCRNIYIVACWAHFGVQEHKWTGKWKMVDGRPVPMVWYYDDHNGEFEEWYKCPITWVTTAPIYMWSFSRAIADHIANALDEYDKKNYNK